MRQVLISLWCVAWIALVGAVLIDKYSSPRDWSPTTTQGAAPVAPSPAPAESPLIVEEVWEMGYWGREH